MNSTLLRKDIEIMAPAGSWESLASAIKAGANSVYFGIEKLNMRSKSSSNFTTDDLRKIVKICHENNVNSYLTVNTIIYDNDLSLMREIIDTAKEAGVSAIRCCGYDVRCKHWGGSAFIGSDQHHQRGCTKILCTIC